MRQDGFPLKYHGDKSSVITIADPKWGDWYSIKRYKSIINQLRAQENTNYSRSL